MIKPATLLFMALIGLALLGRLDNDGLLARGDLLAARALGYEVRVEVTLRRPAAAEPAACAGPPAPPPAGPPARRPAGARERPCE